MTAFIRELLGAGVIVVVGLAVAHVVDVVSASLAQRDLDLAEERRRNGANGRK